LLDIVLLVVCAVVSGADGWESIEEFGREKRDWLRQFGRFANWSADSTISANARPTRRWPCS
jgi:hypothetical protein